MKQTHNELMQKFINDELFLHNYTKMENMLSQNYEARLTVKIGTRIEKNLQAIFSSEEGITLFKNLLSHEELYIRFIAARYLYPLMPKETMAIMQEYKNGLSDPLEKHEVETVIKGLKNKQAVFIEQFKKLYGIHFEKYSCI